MKRTELVFVPAPGIGHLASTIEFAKRLIDRDSDRLLSVTVLSMKFSFVPFSQELTDSLVGSYHATIKVVHLPDLLDPPSTDLHLTSPEYYFYSFIHSFAPHVKAALTDVVSNAAAPAGASSDSDQHPSDTKKVNVALFLDFFCMSFTDVGDELGLPSYLFLPSSAAFLALMLYLPVRHAQKSSEFDKVVDSSDPGYYHSIPGFSNPVPTRCCLRLCLTSTAGTHVFWSLLSVSRRPKGL